MIKIAKALKLKNQLAGEVAELKQILASQNVRSTRQKFDYNNQEVLARLRAKVDDAKDPKHIQTVHGIGYRFQE